jgi:xyloglucan:xyloglucosyl transferase
MAASARLLTALAAFVAAVAATALDTSPVPFDAGYAALFGGDNLVRSPDGRGVTLKLDRYTGK